MVSTHPGASGLGLRQAVGNRAIAAHLAAWRATAAQSGLLQRCDDLDEQRKAAGRALNQRHREPAPAGGTIEMDVILQRDPPPTPLQRMLAGRGYALGPLDREYISIQGTDVLLHWQALSKRDAGALFDQIMQVLEGRGLDAYRGIAMFHLKWGDAVSGRAVSLGDDREPGFTTWTSRFVPFSVDRATAQHAAKSRKGMSNPGHEASLDAVPGFDRLRPEAVCGLVLYVHVTRDTPGVVFFNVGELQLLGPIACEIVDRFRKREMA